MRFSLSWGVLEFETPSVIQVVGASVACVLDNGQKGTESLLSSPTPEMLYEQKANLCCFKSRNMGESYHAAIIDK